MSEQDEYSLTFRERAVIESTASAVVRKMLEKFPSLGTNGASWADFWYSLAKGAAQIVLGFIALAALWATITYLKAGAPAVPGVTH